MAPAAYAPRFVDKLLERRMQHHAAILLVGPRATGKTTTAVRLAASVLRLDRPAQATVVRADPDAALRDLAEPVLIDEWQVVPDVLGAVKRAVDTDPRPGRFLITGSVRGDVDSPTWPGTGRLVRVAMYGLTVSEIRGHIPQSPLLDQLAAGDLDALGTLPPDPLDLHDYAELALRGGFPEPVLRLPPSEHRPWLQSYIDQLLTRDVAQLAGRRNPELMRAFFEAHAVNTAGIVDQRTLRKRRVSQRPPARHMSTCCATSWSWKPYPDGGATGSSDSSARRKGTLSTRLSLSPPSGSTSTA